MVWQSAFVLADLLLRHPPFGQWHDVRVLDLGTGTGEQTHQAAFIALQVMQPVLGLPDIISSLIWSSCR